MTTFTQLCLFEEPKTKRIYFRDRLGRFTSKEMSEIEKLYRENNRLKAELEMWKRKAKSLAHYKIEIQRIQTI